MKNIYFLPLFVLAITLFSACQKDPVNYKAFYAAQAAAGTGTTSGTGTTGTGTTNSSGYYVNGTLNNTAIAWQGGTSATGFSIGGLAALQQNSGVETGSLSALLSKNNTLQPNIGFQFQTYTVSTTDNTAYFETFVSTGTLPFATSYLPGPDKVLTINYTDADGNLYSSVGAQASSATIVSVTKVTAQNGSNESLKIKLTFSCNLYPVGSAGAALTFDNVEATVNLENLL